ncbi:golvesin C-terminal-like domain-containing protein [Streptomyces sp. BE230]|uniref:golvesin C-terminal-like domain-containing protein n=1 Tax=Streptomyces sp. BE230 TaxID=3002526 RepID=UPI002ED37FD8|nr:DNRLRE domain-containing protein [Streptomyces sp. BE230]
MVVAAVVSTALPQLAYAAPASSPGHDGDKGVVNTIKGWFSDDDGEGSAQPSAGGKLAIPSREKLPKGKESASARRVKELTSRRTEHARFWELSDGRVQAEISTMPTGYEVGKGKTKSWKSIDTGVSTTDTKGFDFSNTSNSARSWFGSEPGKLLKFQAGEDGPAVTLGLEGAESKAVSPTATGSTVTYKDVTSGGADLQYQVGPGHVKENILLAKAPTGPVSYTFTLDAGGLTPKARKDGSIALYGELPNTPVMTIPAAYMTDTRKDASSPYGLAYSSRVGQKLVRDGDGWKIVVTPDATWLASGKRQYPVTIDPTITVMPTAAQSQDTMVLSDQPSANFNNTWKLSAGKTDTGISRSLIKFPMNEIPTGTKIDTARLEMYYDQTHTTNANDVTIEAHRATGAWDESTATWSNTSALSGELSGTTYQIDDGDAGTAAVGEWPKAATTGGAATGDDYAYNKNTATGETYTWQPQIPETASYRIEAHVPPASDAATAAPYTISHRDGTATGTVNQAGTAAAWKPVSSTQYYFARGNTGKVVLGDTGSSTTRNIADSIRLVNPAQIVKDTGEYNAWHKFAVTDTVQKWVSGTAANNGFVLQAKDDTAAATLTGGPRYEAGDGSTYGDETASFPRLTITYGKVGSALNSPTVVHDTGPELTWSAYSNKSGDSGQDIVEYQLHRSTQQVFTPSAATLVAPVDKAATAYTDTTATPTPPTSAEEISRTYYYQIAVKTKDGSVIGSPTRVVGVPKSGRTMKLVQGTAGGVTDTTLSSQQPTTNQDTIQSFGVGQKWLSVGNNSGTYGKTRTALKFPTASIPTTATVLESKLYMWGAETTTDTDGAIYELHGLNMDFAETTSTWNSAATGTAWTAPGGDFSGTVSDTVAQVEEVGRHWWDATSLTQGWVKTPTSNKGALVKLKDETAAGPQERTLFLSSEGEDQQLGPLLRVIYVDATTENTYYAPQTPARMTPNSTYTVDMTVTNTTSTTWAAGERVLSYTWKLPDGTDVTTGGNQVKTAVPALAPAASATVKAQVQTPINSDSGSKRTEYVLGWDIQKVSDSTWLSAGTGGIPALKQNVAVEDPTSNALGLEKFYSYTGKNTGAGSTFMNNLASGNGVWSYNAFTNPGRGLNTFFRVAYNSLDTSDTVSGGGWSAQAAGPVRLGAALDFHPNPNPTEIRLPDGDGTTHIFRKQGDGTWKAPAGVHYRVIMKAGLDCTPNKDPIPDAWTLTRPDGTRFLFGCDGYMTSAVDKNGNTQTFTYEERKSNNKPTKFLRYVTDPAGRQTLTLEYYSKTDTNDPKIIDHIKSVTDVSDRKLTFEYSDKGLLTKLTDGAGSVQPKEFAFEYDATQGNKNVKLVKVTDPRGNPTVISYNAPQTGDDPKYHWWTKTINDRLQGNTAFTYAPDATNPKFTDAKVTDAESRATQYVADDFGRPVQSTNAKSQTTKVSWDADNNVTYMEEANGAKTAYCYDQKTGYPVWQRNAENNKAGLPAQSDCAPGVFPANAQKYEYQTRLDGFSADISKKTSPEGRTWQFGYDIFGNLRTVTDPKGVASTSVAGDYTTSYEYDAHGQVIKVTDANGNPTTNSDFGPNGYPATITDALNKPTSFVYDERGQVTQVTDALGKKTTQTYDVYGRPLVKTEPKDQNAGALITTPAPVYDANDNITTSTAPNGAVSTAVYDAADQLKDATAPKYTTTSDERKSTFAYDKVGNVLTTVEPKGALTTTDPGDYRTTNTYDENYQLTSVINATGDKVSYEYDSVGNVVTVVDPKKNATADTTDYTSKTVYDLNHRVTQVMDAAGKTTKTSYDKDSLVVASTDAENNTTLVTYDERGKQSQVKVPHEGTSPVTYRTTKYEYDQVGSTTAVITPRGVDSASADDFTARTEYDAMNRPVKQFQPYDSADPRHNNADVYTQTFYDAAGRVSKTSSPPSEGQAVRNDTSYTYFDNGWAKSSTDSWDVVTTYDYNELGKQTARTLTSAAGSSNRTMAWSYFPDGKLKSKSDDGVPVGSAVVLVDNSDTQNTSASGTWTGSSATGQQGYDHRVHSAGAGSDSFTWDLNVPKDGTYTAYVKYPKVTGAATAAKYTVTKSDGTTTDVTRDQNAAAGTWVSLGSFAFAQGNSASVRLLQNSAGAVVADGIKLVRDNSGDADTEKRTFTYGYDANGNLISIDDSSSGAKVDAYTLDYTGLNQVAKITEALGGEAKKSTSLTYDANGQAETVNHPDQFSKYTYDLRELVKTVTIGKSATDASPKVSSYTYTDRRLKLKETKANGNTVDYAYYLDRSLKSSSEKKPNGTLVSSHAYTYDADGNKVQDAARKMNADDHAAYLSSTTDYSYDPVNRLSKSVKTGNGAGTETYVHDDNANVVSQTVKGESTTFTYDRNRLLKASVAGTDVNYNYDPFGRQESVIAGGQIIERSEYDGFDHVVKSEKMDDTGALKSTRYSFDPLDRTTTKTTDGKTTEFEYLGLSNEVLDEKVAGALTKSYQYSPWGERLSQVKHNSNGTTENGYYGYNSHTDVETLTDGNGDTKATYGYTAYGKDDKDEFTGIDKPDAGVPGEEAYNPYRYNSKRWDAQAGTYDMGFRDYNPGLNRFTSRDMYNGALADMKLGADPFTGNRYAFTGGNPTSMVELDGHRLDDGSGGGTCSLCSRENTFLYNPFDLCAACNFGIYNSAHDTAILLVAGWLRSAQPKGGGEVTMDLQQSGGLRNPRNAISGGSSQNPGLNVGYADLLYWTDTTVYIWDAKHAGGSAEAGGKRDVEKKVDALQKQLKANGDNRTVKSGFSFPAQSGVNWKNGAEWVTAWPSARSSSVIAYSMRKIETKKLPETEPAKEPAGRPSWLTGALMIGAGVVVGAVAAADDVTGIGVADDPVLFPAAGGLITGGALAFQ